MSEPIPAKAKRYPLPPGGRLVSKTRPICDPSGREGVITRFARTRNAMEKSGDRVVAVRWSDTGEVSLRYCRGKQSAPG